MLVQNVEEYKDYYSIGISNVNKIFTYSLYIRVYYDYNKLV